MKSNVKRGVLKSDVKRDRRHVQRNVRRNVIKRDVKNFKNCFRDGVRVQLLELVDVSYRRVGRSQNCRSNCFV